MFSCVVGVCVFVCMFVGWLRGLFVVRLVRWLVHVFVCVRSFAYLCVVYFVCLIACLLVCMSLECLCFAFGS